MGKQGSKVHDVCIVGAGPAGSTLAFYLARRGADVLLVEKERFPRDKICGDAICAGALGHLEAMGVLAPLVADSQGRFTRTGGLVSPSGLRYVAESAGPDDACLVIAVKRRVLDERMAQAAVRAGAHLQEGCPVAGATLDQIDGIWTVLPEKDSAAPFRARLLVAADGAGSGIARALDILDKPPEAVCSRSYVRAGTHRFDLDGMVYYLPEMLPGYAAIHREADGDLNFCCYLVPGGRCSTDDLGKMHRFVLREYPPVRDAIGPDAEVSEMQSAPLRLGGVVKSYADQFLMVGDAAGQIDPLTGEGIHCGMEAAQIASEVILEALDRDELGEDFLCRYQWRWRRTLGIDFFWSGQIASAIKRYPVLLDAFAELSERRGADFMMQWAGIMTGRLSKSRFFKPSLALPLLAFAARRSVRGPRT